MNVIYEHTKYGPSPVWENGLAVVDSKAWLLLVDVQGEWWEPAPPREIVSADITNPVGALASFILAFPNSEFYGVGDDFEPLVDREDSVDETVF